MEQKKKHAAIEADPQLPTEFPVNHTSTAARRTMLIRALTKMHAAVKLIREAGEIYGPTRTVETMIIASECFAMDVIHTINVMKEAVGKGKKC